MDNRFDCRKYSDVPERRDPGRLQLDVHLDDLQAELEAGARTLEKIDAHAFRLDDHVATHLRQAGLAGELLRQVQALKQSVAQQRATLLELRAEMQALRQQLRRKREDV
jgi:hypothetical protein